MKVNLVFEIEDDSDLAAVIMKTIIDRGVVPTTAPAPRAGERRPEPKQAAVQAPAPVVTSPEPEAKEPTLKFLRAELTAFVQKHGTPAAVKILAEFEVKKLGELAESEYQAFYEALRSAYVG